AKVRERWGVEPGQIADVLALMGDTIDNIKGVRGVGEKTAVKLIAQYGSVDRLYENLTLIPGKLRETLAAGRKDALLSRELALLNRQVPVAIDLGADESPSAFGERALIIHDAKPLIEFWLARGVTPPAIHDSAVAAYLLNSARQSYRLEQVCIDALGEYPPAADPSRAFGVRAD